MKINKRLFGLFVFLTTILLTQVTQGYAEGLGPGYVMRNGKPVARKLLASESVECHFENGKNAFNAEDWGAATFEFSIVSLNFPNDPRGHLANYYLGIAYYFLEEYEFANDAFSKYLKAESHPAFFNETIEYKFAIAEAFRCGAKRQIFSSRKSPKWGDAKELTLTIYDEIIAALPSQNIATRSLFRKGCLLLKMREYRDSVEAFRTLIRRFPKHELAPESYLAIARVYLCESDSEFQNPDVLALAEINLRKFKEDFPREERITQAEGDVIEIKELNARSLYEMGQFYERTNHPSAAIIYYRSAVQRFPDASIVDRCQWRLACLESAS
jgi:outer membrane protein assembly factor BamD (BamD/ComL family)